MIFLTVGSHEPFDRLVKAVDSWCAANTGKIVTAQITSRGNYRPQHMTFTGYMSESQYRAACRKADLLIAHAGMGSILTALDFAKPIVIMPRFGRLKETRNDHQIATAQQFRGRHGIFVADDETLITSAIDRARAESNSGERLPKFAEPRLIAFLAATFRR